MQVRNPLTSSFSHDQPCHAGRGLWSGWSAALSCCARPHRVELTLAGEALLGAAVPLLADLNDAVALTRSAGGEVAARVAQLWDSVADDGQPGLPQMREAYEALNAQFPVPDGTRVRARCRRAVWPR